ncbi:MAG: metalloregulator ArsR/SmtB family transcription factor [Henriciella sp.]|nr:metalloregulator ArsR/SmtB family transcription factor [Henriciella sp.]
MDEARSAMMFAALGHPNRVRVLRKLVQAGSDGLSVGQLRQTLGVPASTFAHHLKALVEAGLIEQNRRGREIYSSVDFDAVRDLAGYLMKDCCAGIPDLETSLMNQQEI